MFIGSSSPSWRGVERTRGPDGKIKEIGSAHHQQLQRLPADAKSGKMKFARSVDIRGRWSARTGPRGVPCRR